MRKLLVFLCAIIISLGVITEAIAAPFQNESLELPGDYNSYLSAGSIYIIGWTVESGTID